MNTPEKKFTITFSGKKKSPFDIKSESSYNANLSSGCLELGLKKSNCIAWTDIPKYKFQDHVIEAKIRLDSKGGYAASGIIFRLADDSYYLALVSSKGYFRVDAVKNGAPRPLIAWTEVSDFNETSIDLKIIAYGDSFIFIVNGKWLGEAADSSAVNGHLGFALASYSDNEDNEDTENKEEYICAAQLDSITIDTRAKAIETFYKKWTDDSNINAEERLKLTETLAVMGESSKALDQLNKAWKRRDDAISSVATSYTEVRTRKELLLASRLAYSLGQYNEAENYINSLLDQNSISAGYSDSAETKFAYTEKLKILNELNKFAELKEFVLTHPGKINKDSDYYTLTARSYWELGDYNDSAEAWDKAFEMGEAPEGGASGRRENAVYAVNAAGAHELAENKVKALSRYITAGNIFLKQSNNAELQVLIPKLLNLGGKNWEARILAGKWAFSVEDYKKSEEEFEIANKLRSSCRPRPKADPAANYLWALILHLKGKNKEAIRLLEAAVKLAPDYGLFRFKLAEIKLKSGKSGSKTAEEFKLALKNINDEQLDGKESVENMAQHAGNLLQSIGDLKNAKYFFDIHR